MDGYETALANRVAGTYKLFRYAVHAVSPRVIKAILLENISLSIGTDDVTVRSRPAPTPQAALIRIDLPCITVLGVRTALADVVLRFTLRRLLAPFALLIDSAAVRACRSRA